MVLETVLEVLEVVPEVLEAVLMFWCSFGWPRAHGKMHRIRILTQNVLRRKMPRCSSKALLHTVSDLDISRAKVFEKTRC